MNNHCFLCEYYFVRPPFAYSVYVTCCLHHLHTVCISPVVYNSKQYCVVSIFTFKKNLTESINLKSGAIIVHILCSINMLHNILSGDIEN